MIVEATLIANATKPLSPEDAALFSLCLTDAKERAILSGERTVVAYRVNEDGLAVFTVMSSNVHLRSQLANGATVVYEVVPTPKPAPDLFPVYLPGRIGTTGRSHERGKVIHWGDGGNDSLCGKTYSGRSAGWIVAPQGTPVTCPQCLKLIAKMAQGDNAGEVLFGKPATYNKRRRIEVYRLENGSRNQLGELVEFPKGQWSLFSFGGWDMNGGYAVRQKKMEFLLEADMRTAKAKAVDCLS
jgi:hypothetical protein